MLTSDRYKLASMFLPEATGLYINTRVTMVLFGMLCSLSYPQMRQAES